MNVIVHGTHVQVLDDRNWNAEWEASIEPVVVNDRIVIVPEWRTEEFSQPLRLVITPKMSFGTGHHATTRMMCRLMEQYVQPDSTWIDVGTGTGVLAILAALLGARDVFAFDNDEWSFVNSQENIERNVFGLSTWIYMPLNCRSALGLPRTSIVTSSFPTQGHLSRLFSPVA